MACLTAAMLLGLCSGCGIIDRFLQQSADSIAEEWSGSVDQLQKSQRIEIYRAGSDVPAAELNTTEEIAAFVSRLGLDGAISWSLSPLPEDAEPTWECVFYQDETVKLGQDTSDLEELQLVRLQFYQQPYLTLTVASIDVSFEIPETYNDYFESLAQ